MSEIIVSLRRDVDMQDSSYISRDDSDGLFSQLRSGKLEMQRGVSDAHYRLPFTSI